jgi:P27 family predicted phage terminase small subunit
MTKGRKPVPNQIKKMRGTFRSDRAEANMIEVSEDAKLVGLPNPPLTLNRYGREAWRFYGELLLQHHLLSAADLMALEMLANAYGRWVEYEIQLKDEGEVLTSNTGNLYTNPLRTVADRAFDKIHKLLAEFGLTPAERTRVASMIQDSETKKSLEQILSNTTSVAY